MYAIIEMQGKQFKAEEGKTLRVPLMADKSEGDAISLDKVLLYSDKDSTALIGSPFLSFIRVSAKVTCELFKDKKIIVYKYKRRKDYHKKQGHRQKYTEILIEKIEKLDKTEKIEKAEKAEKVKTEKTKIVGKVKTEKTEKAKQVKTEKPKKTRETKEKKES